ncbi:MAG TPA: hypothetical protein VIY53_15200 [Acidobacteriaceae bacterium]
MTRGPALVAIDLGAESCRVSPLQWQAAESRIRMAHRFPVRPIVTASGICRDLDGICRELMVGLRRSAEIAADGIARIGVAGWAGAGVTPATLRETAGELARAQMLG